MDSELETVIADFNRRWDKGQIEGWTDNTAASTIQEAGIWCDACEFGHEALLKLERLRVN